MEPNPPPMILPKGIVVNAPSVYEEIAKYPTLPYEKVWKIWNVYTTTNKKLEDPTARRLENFWWHVLGSNRKHLSGQTLAKLFEQISRGPTFVPLRGPPNRWEQPDVPHFKAPRPDVKLQGVPVRSTPNGATSPPTASSQKISTRSTADASASRPPPPHPILKKTRGPSGSGPRPTARFVSPHESADEEDTVSDGQSSGSTAVETPVVRRSANGPVKKRVTTGKKFVASSKRRPVLPRRASSQSSTASETGPKEGSSLTLTRASISQRPISPIPEKPSRPASPGSDETNSPTRIDRGGLSAKAAGKRPAGSSSAATEKKKVDTLVVSPIIEPPKTRKQQPAHKLINESIPQVRSMIDLPLQSRHRVGAIPNRGHHLVVPDQSKLLEIPTEMARSSSHNGYNRPPCIQRASSGRQPAFGLFTKSTATMTSVAAQGTIIDQSGAASLPSTIEPHELPKGAITFNRPSINPILDNQLTPTPPSVSASVPLGRTKSQLTLLLERQDPRQGKKPRSKG